MAYNVDANVIEVNLTSPTTADVKVLNGGETPIDFNLIKENGAWKLNDVNNFKSTVASYQEPSM